MSRILLGVSGGIAAYKALEFVRLATGAGHAVRVVQTPTSRRFVGEASFAALTGAPVLLSEFEHDPARGAFPDQQPPAHRPIGHLELVRNADLYLIAPASANTLAKLAHGHADNLLTSAALAATCPVVVAPAMNHHMYLHPATRANLDTLRAHGVHVIEPDSGRLASKGEEGIGRLPEPAQLLEMCERLLAETGTDSGDTRSAHIPGSASAADACPPASAETGTDSGDTRSAHIPESASAADACPPASPESGTDSGDTGSARIPESASAARRPASAGAWSGRRVLVTAGGTREPIDSVRFVGNSSSGRMGLALAQAARERGARVTVIAANVALPRPAGVTWREVRTAAQLKQACDEEFPGCDVLLMAAAVADFRPTQAHDGKLKKAERDKLRLELEPTADVLSELAANRRDDQLLVGFAAEHGEQAVTYGHEKLGAKGLDAIVVNDISRPDIGFESDSNEVTILTAAGQQHVPRAAKAEVADAILDAVEGLHAPTA